MSIRINQEINNIRNGVKNLNIVTTDNTQAILDEATLARANENNIFSALLIEKTRAQNAESAIEQAIFSEATRAAVAEAANALLILKETTRASNAEGILDQRITTEIADEVIRASGEEAAIALLILTETTRAIAAEGTNAQEILDETTRATTAEGTLTTETERLADEQNQLIGHNIHYGFRALKLELVIFPPSYGNVSLILSPQLHDLIQTINHPMASCRFGYDIFYGLNAL